MSSDVMAAARPEFARRSAAAASFDGTIAGWLLHAPVQLASGPHAGAIAGALTEAGDAPYVYPEIAGYYLQWLAWRAQFAADADALAVRATAVQRWLAVWLAAGDAPPTRVHFDGAHDWRNDAVFFFDIAMVLRGLGAAAQARLLLPDAAVVSGVVRQLSRLLAADGEFDACAVKPGAAPPAARWSTRRGPFLAKAAAGVLTASRALPGIPAQLTVAAEATFASSLSLLAQAPHREAHPLLYAFEGALALPSHARVRDGLPVIAEQFDRLLARAGTDGFLPETIGEAVGPKRIDVVAQALRVGHLLTAHRPQDPPDRVALARLSHTLARQVRASGAVPFARDGVPPRLNVWAAMFADQALALAKPAAHGDAAWRDAPLVV
ncbi:MAG: hypothetical protein U1F15_03320 [Burkholderiales bacterium]